MSMMSDTDMYHHYGLHIPTRTVELSYGATGEDADGIDEISANRVIRNLRLLHHLDAEAPIEVLINCQGGAVTHGLAIYDYIASLPNEVTGTVQGYCLSMAVWVLQACDYRQMNRHGELMIHNGTGDKTEWDKRQDKLTENILLRRIKEKQPRFQRAHLKRLLEKDTYMSADEALKLGLIDRVLG